jgi:hypothetical protein
VRFAAVYYTLFKDRLSTANFSIMKTFILLTLSQYGFDSEKGGNPKLVDLLTNLLLSESEYETERKA